MSPSTGHIPTPLDKPIASSPSHEPHHCCGKEFSSKQAYKEHFDLVHDPKSPSYVEPENHNAPAEPAVEGAE